MGEPKKMSHYCIECYKSGACEEQTVWKDDEKPSCFMSWQDEVRKALDEILTARFNANKNGCLVSVRWLAFRIAQQTGVVQDRNLFGCVEQLLEQDERVMPWGWGRSRAWNVKKQERYATPAARIFQLMGAER
jgi:hypothetical protein